MTEKVHKILIVEDSESIRLKLEVFLKKLGYSYITSLATGDEALVFIEELPQPEAVIDLILMDVNMPGTNGIEVCRILKKQYPDLPVIMATAMSVEESIEAAFEAGASDYVTKPFQIAELKTRLNSVLKLKDEMNRRRRREFQLDQKTGELSEHIRRVSLLNEMSRQISLAADENEVFRLLAGFIAKAFNAARISVARVLPRWDEFELFTVTVTDGKSPATGPYKIQDTAVETVTRKNKLLVSSDVAAGTYEDWDQLAESGLPVIMSAPIELIEGRLFTLNIAKRESKNFDESEQTLFLQTTAILGKNIQNRRLVTQLKESLNAITSDLETARRVQQNLIPGEFGDDPVFTVAARYRPTELVGGDLYDFIRFGDGCLGLFVADVSGHGVPAAMVSSMAKLGMSILGRSTKSPAQHLENLNAYLCNRTADHFLTCFYGILDPKNKTMRYANAGHPPFLLLRDGAVSLHKADGKFLCIFDGIRFEEVEVPLKQGDRLIFYTDGITEATSPAGEEYGEARFSEAVLNGAGEAPALMLDSILNQVTAFQELTVFQDDVTLVAVEIK